MMLKGQKGTINIALYLIIMGIIMAVFVTTVILTSPTPDGTGGTNGEATPTPTPAITPTPTPGTTPTPTQTPSDGNGTGTQKTNTQFGRTADNRQCMTGSGLVERVLLDWDARHFSASTCDADGNGYFCDATQFSLSLAHRLESIRSLERAGKKEEAQEMLEFESYVIPDNFSEDFQKDFTHYYSTQFFASPGWFSDWNKYFSNPDKLSFLPRNLSQNQPALYKVKIQVVNDKNDFSFFDDFNANSIITIEFDRQRDFDANRTFFYEVAFDGLVGVYREDYDGKIERKDYGAGFRASVDQLVLQESGAYRVDSGISSGLKLYSVAKTHEFRHTNSRSGILGYVDTEKEVIVLSPANAWVVIAEIDFLDRKADMFYRIYEDGLEIGSGQQRMNTWTSVAREKTPQAGALAEFATPKYDWIADETETCMQVKIDGGTAFGFHLDPIERINKAYLKSYFFTPANRSVSLQNACGDRRANFYTYRENSPMPNSQISFDNSMDKFQHFHELPELIRNEKVCMIKEGTKEMFFWNINKLELQEDTALTSNGARALAMGAEPKSLIGGCKELDSGNAPEEPGLSATENERKGDKCILGLWLKEYYCENGEIEKKIYNCKNYCGDAYDPGIKGSCEKGPQGFSFCDCEYPAPKISHARLSPAEGRVGTIFSLQALVKNHKSVESAEAKIYLNGSLMRKISLFDDGKHNDLKAGDGIFGGKIDSFKEGLNPGTYTALVSMQSKRKDKKAAIKELEFSISRDEALCMELAENGNPASSLDIVFVADDFENREEFENAAKEAMDELFRVEPYASKKDKFNFYTLFPDRDFNCYYENGRYIDCDWQPIRAYIGGHCNYDRAIVLHKGPYFGGIAFVWGKLGAAAYTGHVLGSSDHSETLWKKVVVHELSHTLGLMDEYVVENSGSPYESVRDFQGSIYHMLPDFIKSSEFGWNCSSDNSCAEWKSHFGNENIDCSQKCYYLDWYSAAKEKNLMKGFTVELNAQGEWTAANDKFSPPAEAILEQAIGFFGGEPE